MANKAPVKKQTPQEDKPSTNSVVALILGIGALLLSLWPVGIVALVMGVKERKAICEGNSPQAGDTLALIAVILGSIATGLTVLGIIGLLIFLVVLLVAYASTVSIFLI